MTESKDVMIGTDTGSANAGGVSTVSADTDLANKASANAGIAGESRAHAGSGSTVNTDAGSGKRNGTLVFFLAALLSYPLAYYYVDRLLVYLGRWTDKMYQPGIGYFIFTLLFVLSVELFVRFGKTNGTGNTEQPAARPGAPGANASRGTDAPGANAAPGHGAAARPGARRFRWPDENSFWPAMLLLQSIALAGYGLHVSAIGSWQFFLWHLTAIYYVTQRTGMLTAGRTGCLIGFDLLMGAAVIPCINLFLRVGSLFRGITAKLTRRHHLSKAVVLGVTAAIPVVLIAWSQLAAADANFANIGSNLSGWLERFLEQLSDDFVVKFVLSLPVGWYLFALVGGSVKRSRPITTQQEFAEATASLRKLPASSAGIVMGALSAVYALFFLMQAAEFALKLIGMEGGAVLSAPDASSFAVKGFWELCRILFLNLLVLGASAFLVDTGNGTRPNPLRQGRLRVLTAVFAASGTAFAALDLIKLGVYIDLYGYTPRRVLSGWFLCMLLICSVLSVVRIFVRFHAVPAAVFVMTAGFVLLTLLPIESMIVHANLARYESGRDSGVDVSVLRECRYERWEEYMDVDIRHAEESRY